MTASAVLCRNRGIPDLNGTFGLFSVNNIPRVVTCELPWKDNAPYISCIPVSPPGRPYICKRHVSAKFPLGNTWEVTGVDGRSEILLHNANDIKQLLGCMCPGLSFGIVTGLPAVLQSVEALKLLNLLLPDEFPLTIC